MILELATVNGKTIGWRITVGTHTALIFENQEKWPGIRVGDEFIPGLNQTIEYLVVYNSNDF